MLQEMTTRYLVPGGKNGMDKRAQKGCLLVHGLTGTPANLDPVADALRATGYIVKAPLLAGHGNNLETLNRSTWPHWYGSVLHAHEVLVRETQKVFYVGLSMGALLGLKLAAEVGNSLQALALLAIPFQLRPLFRHFVIPSIRYSPLRFVIRSVAKNFEKSILDPEGRELYRQNSIHRMPGKAVFQCEDLRKEVSKNLSKIKQPLLFIHGHRDHLADPRGLLEIQRKVGTKKMDVVMMENSAHVLSLDYDREEVAKRVVSFFESFASA